MRKQFYHNSTFLGRRDSISGCWKPCICALPPGGLGRVESLQRVEARLGLEEPLPALSMVASVEIFSSACGFWSFGPGSSLQCLPYFHHEVPSCFLALCAMFMSLWLDGEHPQHFDWETMRSEPASISRTLLPATVGVGETLGDLAEFFGSIIESWSVCGSGVRDR